MITEIVVCDNSDFDYSKCSAFLNKRFNKEIEFLHFAGDTIQTTLQGKGFGEGQIMEYVMSNSLIINRSSSFCKVTGRINIVNIDALLEKVDHKYDYFQRIGINPFKDINKVDTRFYHSTMDTFTKYLSTSYELVNDGDGVYLEHVYYNELNKADVPYRNFKRLPQVEGYSGSTGENYGIAPGRWHFLKATYAILDFFNVWNR